MAKELKNINLYATTVMQSKRLIDAGIDDSTADMKYLWHNTAELQTNFFKRKKVETYKAHTLLDPCCAIINDVGDLEILDYDIPQLKDDGNRSVVFKTKDERVSLRLSNYIGEFTQGANSDSCYGSSSCGKSICSRLFRWSTCQS